MASARAVSPASRIAQGWLVVTSAIASRPFAPSASFTPLGWLGAFACQRTPARLNAATSAPAAWKRSSAAERVLFVLVGVVVALRDIALAGWSKAEVGGVRQ